MAKKKPPRPGRTPRSAEPTTAQLRREHRRRRDESQALQELGLLAPQRPSPPGDAGWWADARDALDRLEIVHAVWRYTGLAGYVPDPEDFKADEGWPLLSEVEAVFGSWDEMLDVSGIDDAILHDVLERALAAHAQLRAREQELELQARKLEEEGRKAPELRRREEVARGKREQAEAARDAAEARHDQLTRERDALVERVAALEREVAELRTAATTRESAPPAEPELVEELERTLERHEATEQARDELHDGLERLRAERDQDRRTIAELTTALARIDLADESTEVAVAVADQPPPATVLEAVQRAAEEARHLRFAPRAFETAAASPFRRPGLVLRTLRALDALAARYDAGDMGRSLAQAAAEHGITQYRPDVAETTRRRYEDDYSFPLDGRRLWVGPHIGLGSGSGAQFIARIYLHVADGGDPAIGRGIIVAAVGRHLPDTTT